MGETADSKLSEKAYWFLTESPPLSFWWNDGRNYKLQVKWKGLLISYGKSTSFWRNGGKNSRLQGKWKGLPIFDENSTRVLEEKLQIPNYVEGLSDS